MVDSPVPVTDPALLKELGPSPIAAPDAPPVAAPGGSTIDPAVLEQLGPSPVAAPVAAPARAPVVITRPKFIPNSEPGSFRGAMRGVLDAPGFIGDLANLGLLGAGKLTGDQFTQDAAHAGLRGDNGFDMGTAGFDNLYDKLGWFNKPDGPEDPNASYDPYERGKLVGNLAASALIPSPAKVLSPLAEDATKAGVTLRSTALGNTYGAQGIVRDAQKKTQDEIARYGENVINPILAPSTQDIGSQLAEQVPKVIDGLTSDVTKAYDVMSATIPATTAVDTTNIQMAMHRVFEDIDNPALKKLLGDNPILQEYAPVFANNQQLTWRDARAFMQDVGAAMHGATGKNLGVLKQLYKSAGEDLTTAAQSVPGGSVAYTDAIAAARTKGNALDDLLSTMESKHPEMLPDWLTAQASKGNTRLEAFRGDTTPEQWDQLGRWLLTQKSTVNGKFDPAAFNKYLSSDKAGLSTEARTSLFGGPPSAFNDTGETLDAALARFQNLYQNTQKGRDLLAAPMTATPPNPLTGGVVGTALGHLTGSLFPEAGNGAAYGALAGAAATKALPLAAGGAAQITTRPAVVDALKGLPFVGAASGLDQGAKAAFPNFYNSAPPAPQPPPEKHSSWMADPSVQLADKTAFVASKVPEIAHQLSTGSDEGDRAALTLAMLNPSYRNQLAG